MRKNKNTFLVILLGCLVLVTAVAGIITWDNGSKNLQENGEATPDNTLNDYLWNEDDAKDIQNESTANTKAVLEAETTKESPSEEETTESAAQAGAEGEAVDYETNDAAQTPSSEAPASDDGDTPGSQQSDEVAAGGEAVDAGQTQNGDAPASAGQASALNFSAESALNWPVEGQIVLDYSMDTTIYFPTLKQYKCNPAILIQGEVGSQVKAAADAVVSSVGYNEEIGNYVVLNLGGEYEITCGQLKDIVVTEGSYVNCGDVIGVIAEPSNYYVVEGANVYFKMTAAGEPVDPLDYLE